MFCAVADCVNPKSRSRYFSFPKSSQLCEQWVRFCRRKNKINIRAEKICIEHFLPEDFERDLPYELGVYSKPRPLKLKADAVPSLRIRDYIEIERLSPSLPNQRKERSVTKRKEIVEALLTEYDQKGEALSENLDVEEEEEDPPTEEIVEVVVDANAYLIALEEENTELRRENFKLKLSGKKYTATIGKLHRQLEESNERYDHLWQNLAGIFSPAQLEKLQTGRRVAWPQRDLQEACLIYATSPSVYQMLLRRGYPLPSKRALQQWDARRRMEQETIGELEGEEKLYRKLGREQQEKELKPTKHLHRERAKKRGPAQVEAQDLEQAEELHSHLTDDLERKQEEQLYLEQDEEQQMQLDRERHMELDGEHPHEPASEQDMKDENCNFIETVDIIRVDHSYGLDSFGDLEEL